MSLLNPSQSLVEYPSSDGQPMADNTLQAHWIVFIRENLLVLFADKPDVFVASDNLIYPVEGDPTIRVAPDVYVAIGRPKGNRGSYQVWLEGGIFPQVIFEILSPSNRSAEMDQKRAFYSDYGAKEYYVYDPDNNTLEVWLRRGRKLNLISVKDQFTSPLMGITFVLAEPELLLRFPNGKPFRTTIEREQFAEEQQIRAEQAEAAREAERQRAEAERQRAEAERQRANRAEEAQEQERQRTDALKAKLRAMGLDPDKL